MNMQSRKKLDKDLTWENKRILINIDANMKIICDWNMGARIWNAIAETLTSATWNQRGRNNPIAAKCQAILKIVKLAKEIKVKDNDIMTNCKALVNMVGHKKEEHVYGLK